MAAGFDYIFQDKRVDVLCLRVNGLNREFRMLAKIEFNSDRKRMSVIIRDLETKKLYLFCKGADSVMKPKLTSKTPSYLVDKTYDDLYTFSTEGLRTLVIAYREMNEEEYLSWGMRYENAQLGEFNVLNNEDQDPADLMASVKIIENLSLIFNS